MSVKPLNSHYSMENPASIYDEEAMTALELAGRTTAKVNEVVEFVNEEIGNIPEVVSKDVNEHIQAGEFDKQINKYVGDLEGRLDNLLGRVHDGSTTLDAEVIDARYGVDGKTYANAGEAIRAQVGNSLFMRGVVDGTTYADILPDANAVRVPGVHVLHFSEGATDIPANLPLTVWDGRIHTLITMTGAYFRQLYITDDHIYTRNSGSGTTWTEWACLNDITQNGGVNDLNYTTALPDVNEAKPGFYSMHFVMGSSAIPANLPFTRWSGKVSLLLHTENEYKRQVLISGTYLYTRYGTANGWNEWVNLTGKETYIIDINGGGDYTSILRALQYHPENTRFIIKNGVYDMHKDYIAMYGSSYFTNYTGYQTLNPQDKGYFLGDGVELIGDGVVRIVFGYTGENTNVKQYFSMLNTSQNNLVENIALELTDGSGRYLIHDDFASAPGVNVFRNLRLSGASHLGTAIGGGFGVANNYLIEGCTITNIKEGIAVAYHNNTNPGHNKLTIESTMCEGSIDLKHYGTGTKLSECIVRNCYAHKIGLRYGDTSNPVDNMKLFTFGNIVRDSADSATDGVSQATYAKGVGTKLDVGYGVEQDIKTGTDLDTLTTPGKFNVDTETTAKTIVNMPPTLTPGAIIVMQTYRKDRIVQMYFSNTYEIYYRLKNTSGGFAAWRRVMDNRVGNSIGYSTPEGVRLNTAVSKCQQSFTPLVDVTNNGAVRYKAGTKYVGIPYVATHYYSADALFNLGLDTLFSMFNNPNSLMYTKHHNNGEFYSGAVCSSFVSWVLGLPIYYTTYDLLKMLDYKDITDLCDLEIGDVLITHTTTGSVEDHVMVISNIFGYEGGISYIEIAEGWSPNFRTKQYSAAQFWGLLNGTTRPGAPYRVGKIPGAKIRTVPPLTINTDIVTEKGDNTYFEMGEDIYIQSTNATIRVEDASGQQQTVDLAGLPKKSGMYNVASVLNSVGTWKLYGTNNEVSHITIIQKGSITLTDSVLTTSGYAACKPCGYAVIAINQSTNGNYDGHIEGYTGQRLTIYSKDDPRYAGTMEGDTLTLNMSALPSAYKGYYVRVFYDTGCGQAWQDSPVIMTT